MIYQEMHINFIIINNKSSSKIKFINSTILQTNFLPVLEVSNKGRNGNMRQITKKDEGCQSEFIQPSPQKHSSCYEDKSFNTNSKFAFVKNLDAYFCYHRYSKGISWRNSI